MKSRVMAALGTPAARAAARPKPASRTVAAAAPPSLTDFLEQLLGRVPSQYQGEVRQKLQPLFAQAQFHIDNAGTPMTPPGAGLPMVAPPNAPMPAIGRLPLSAPQQAAPSLKAGPSMPPAYGRTNAGGF